MGKRKAVAEPASNIWIDAIPRLWAAHIRADLAPEWLKARKAELRWLRASLEADCLPDWCIEMVMENW